MTMPHSLLLSMRNVVDRSSRENHNTNVMFNNIFQKIMPFVDNEEKYGKARQATDDNIIQHMRIAC
jgi:hypothetical protein